MKVNPNIDELLCGFIDGELPLRQQTEVRRMAARDPEVGRRLRQLQNCKALINAMPRAEAPDEMLEQVKVSLERRTLLAEQADTPRVSSGAWHLVIRKSLAAAAMVALLAVLGVVVYQIVAPVSHTGTSGPLISAAPGTSGAPTTARTAVADAGFSGRLVLATGALVQTDAVIKSAIEESGVIASLESDTTDDARVYRLVSTRQGVRRMVGALGAVWQNFDAATLYISNPETMTDAVAVEAVTPMQAASIVTQKDVPATLAMARDYAVLNGMSQDMPGKEVFALFNDTTSVLESATIPRPKMAGPRDDAPKKTLVPTDEDGRASLMIVLRSSK